jgi:Ca2+-binding RTX toxin-like protein
VALDLAAANLEGAYGAAGDDRLDASGLGTAVRLYGRAGDDTLLGGDGNDRLYGQAGDDRLEGGDGNDTLIGGAGADALLGGDGNDRLYFDADDTLIDGGAGFDWAYAQGTDGVALDLAAANLEGAYGAAGDDRLDASGLGTAVRLYGRAGDDTLLGGDGNDRLYGQAGDDRLEGGLGNDLLYGGSGSDRFEFGLGFNADQSLATAPGIDRVMDFSIGQGDTLAFQGVVDVNGDAKVDLDDLLALEADGRMNVSEAGSRVMIDFNGGGSVALMGLADGTIASIQNLLDSGVNLAVDPVV